MQSGHNTKVLLKTKNAQKVNKIIVSKRRCHKDKSGHSAKESLKRIPKDRWNEEPRKKEVPNKDKMKK